MPSIAYDVEVIRQEMNPICWVASCAMVKGYGLGASVGVGDLTEGFDPYNSCIANLAGSWVECTDMMAGWGFQVRSVSDLTWGGLSADMLLDALQANGPAVLLHRCEGFPYGPQYDPSWIPAGSAHAVVITGVDTDAGTATFNNPWGDKDQVCDLQTLVDKINADQDAGPTLGFWPS